MSPLSRHKPKIEKKIFLKFFDFRKKFGWWTFGLNLVSYFLFLIPLTALTVYDRTNKDIHCKKDNSTESGYDVCVVLCMMYDVCVANSRKLKVRGWTRH